MQNKTPSTAKITAIGTYTPKQILTNEDLEKLVDTNDEWIVQRTGIRERRIAAANEFTSDLCIAAVNNLLHRYKPSLTDVDLVMVATTTPDHAFPSVASQIQDKFKVQQAGALDLNATCAGFTYGLHLANGLITSGLHHKILVIAAETLSKVTDYSDRTTCILFGDGAGAVLVERDEHDPTFLSHHLGSEGSGGIHVYRSGLSNQMKEKELIHNQLIVQNGREVYKWAASTIPHVLAETIKASGLNKDQVDWFIPHSANLRMIESICEKSHFPLEKTLYSLEYFGNTSAATIPLAIDLGIQAGKIKNGQNLVLCGFGGGLVYAGLMIRWDLMK